MFVGSRNGTYCAEKFCDNFANPLCSLDHKCVVNYKLRSSSLTAS